MGQGVTTFCFQALLDQLESPSLPCADPAAGQRLETRSSGAIDTELQLEGEGEGKLWPPVPQ